MTGQSETSGQKWRRRLLVFAVVTGLYFAAGEAFRAYARAQLEKDMRANFEKLQCPSDQMQGDVCLAYPDEGRCIAGEYIDYRTVWQRVHGRQEIVDLIGSQYDSLGRDKQKLANWFACQGFTQVRIRPAREWANETGINLFFAADYKAGYSAWTNENWPWVIRPIAGVADAVITISFDDSINIKSVAIGAQRAIY